LWQWHITLEIEGIGAKAIHMLGGVRTETGNRGIREVQPLCEELVEHSGLRLDVVKD